MEYVSLREPEPGAARPETEGDRILAVMVLAQALRDAVADVGDGRGFFLDWPRRGDLERWCEPLGLEPAAVRDAVRRLLALPPDAQRARLAVLSHAVTVWPDDEEEDEDD